MKLSSNRVQQDKALTDHSYCQRVVAKWAPVAHGMVRIGRGILSCRGTAPIPMVALPGAVSLAVAHHLLLRYTLLVTSLFVDCALV
jgi:hypothetical protein